MHYIASYLGKYLLENCYLQCIPKICTRFVLYVWLGTARYCSYPSGLLYLHWGNNCPSASEETLKNMGECFTCINFTPMLRAYKKHNATTCIFYEMYYMCMRMYSLYVSPFAFEKVKRCYLHLSHSSLVGRN